MIEAITKYVVNGRTMDSLEEAEAFEAELAEIDARQAARILNSQKARWNRAIKSLRGEGVHVRQNIMQCCRGCVTESDLNMKDKSQPVAWTFGGQQNAYSWIEDTIVSRSTINGRRSYSLREGAETEIYFNHDNGAAAATKAAFEAEGFSVDWDGEDFKCVIVKVNA